MGSLRGWRCDICKADNWDARPSGWRHLSFERKSVTGTVYIDTHVVVCSDACDDIWTNTRARELQEMVENETRDEDQW